MIKIATWNVNSIKARLDGVKRWLGQARPSVLLMQEIKCQTEAFPTDEFTALGYQSVACGQKSYNGVAVLSDQPIEVELDHLPGDESDEQARYLEVRTHGLRIASIYLPNGNPPDTDKYSYKLAWMERLQAHVAELLKHEEPFVLGGDYNVIPDPVDCHDPKVWANDALFRLETRRRFRTILNLGVTEAYRSLNPRSRAYSFWDYQGGAWDSDHGIRIDHHLLSAQAADRLVSCSIDREPRGWKKASDHTPVICELSA